MSDTEAESASTSADGPSSTRPTVVGIGTSAGGLQALKRFFADAPTDAGIAYVVVMHLSADKESHVAELLQPHSNLPIAQVTDEIALEPDQVYVIPPGRNISAVDSHLRLTPLEKDRRDRAPIDHFLRTLAQTFDGRSIAVILSGTGSDGAQGVRAIREQGGVVIVQDPQEAEFDGMPRNAVGTGAVDLVLGVDQMLRRIVDLVRTRPRIELSPPEKKDDDVDRDLVGRILTQIRVRTGQDFSRYKRSTIERRIERRMQLQGVERLPTYLELVRANSLEASALAEDLLINVTSFFRDPAVFEYLEREVLPALFRNKGAEDRVRVWSVGCATGEEAYSIGIMLLEEREQCGGKSQIQIFASDLHERSLQYAREGLYPETIEADVSPARLQRFFQKEPNGYRVRKELREIMVFAPHDLLRDPPFSRLDLVCCRNVLIYLQREVQEEVIELFHYTLQGSGYLVLGTAETLGRSDLFYLESKDHHIYRRNADRPTIHLPNLPIIPRLPKAGEALSPAVPRREALAVYGSLHARMVEKFAPPSLVVGSDFSILHLSEHAGRYLQLAGGLPTSNLFKLVSEELRLELRSALQLVSDRQTTYRSKPVSVNVEGAPRKVILRVSPMGGEGQDGLALVMFDEVSEDEDGGDAGDSGTDARVRVLEAELELTRTRFQTLVEEYETGQEEMRASNEELQSANEELRSTMEELETGREELQSINEELQTLNQENRHKVEELSQLSSDLQNLLKVTDIATLFLDRSFRILRFTPRVGEIFNIRNADRGRPLADFTHRLGHIPLHEDARKVLETLIPSEREVHSDNGKWYLVRTVPYRTLEDRIDGVVITLIDVTTLKNTELALRQSEERHRLIVENALDYAILTTDAAGIITSWSPGAEAVLGWTANQAIGQDLAITFTPEDRDRGEPEKERDLAGREGAAPDVRWHQTRTGKRVFIQGVSRVMLDTGGRPAGYLKIGQDATARRWMEEALREREERLRLFGEASSDVIWIRDAESLQLEYLSPAFEAVFGRDRQSILDGDDLSSWVSLIAEEDRQAVVDALERVRSGERVKLEYRVLWPDQSIRWLRNNDFPIPDESGRIRRIGGISQDISEQKSAEAALHDLNQQLEQRVQERTSALMGEVQERIRSEENRRELLQQLVMAGEMERRRLSRELHDQMGQQVTGLILGLRSAAGVPEKERSARLRELEGLASQIAKDLQTLAVELRPPALDSLGLVAALQGHLEDWAQRHGLEHDFHSQNLLEKRLSPEIETTLYRIVQEGLTNVVKHAGASRVNVLLDANRGEIRAILEDDGAGFDVAKVLDSLDRSRSLGLRGMKERLSPLGGELEIESTPGKGTTLFVRIPYPEVASASGGRDSR